MNREQRLSWSRTANMMPDTAIGSFACWTDKLSWKILWCNEVGCLKSESDFSTSYFLPLISIQKYSHVTKLSQDRFSKSREVQVHFFYQSVWSYCWPHLLFVDHDLHSE